MPSGGWNSASQRFAIARDMTYQEQQQHRNRAEIEDLGRQDNEYIHLE